MAHPVRTFIRLTSFLVVLLVLAACGDDSLSPAPDAPPEAPILLQFAPDSSGNGQVGTRHRLLPNSLRVIATQAGVPVHGLEVHWSALQAHGEIVGHGLTDAQGIATAQWILGSVGVRQASAALANGAIVRFRAIAQPADIEVVTEGALQGEVGLELPMAIVVRVHDDGTRLADEPIVWQTSDGQRIPGRTDLDGLASFRLVLGQASGPQPVRIRTELDPENGATTIPVTALPGPPERAELYSESGGVAGDMDPSTVPYWLTEPYPWAALVLFDRFGNPAAGAEVRWELLSGDGELQAAVAVADAGGVAWGRFLARSSDQPYRARAHVQGLSPITTDTIPVWDLTIWCFFDCVTVPNYMQRRVGTLIRFHHWHCTFDNGFRPGEVLSHAGFTFTSPGTYEYSCPVAGIGDVRGTVEFLP